jgi:hypothetical protein
MFRLSNHKKKIFIQRKHMHILYTNSNQNQSEYYYTQGSRKVVNDNWVTSFTTRKAGLLTQVSREYVSSAMKYNNLFKFVTSDSVDFFVML